MKKFVFLAALLFFVGSAYATADITTGLVGWWKMDGPTDPTNVRLVKDYSGFGNDGTMGSSDIWLDGGGIDFAGGSWGATQVVFANYGADLIADMGLTDQVTISFIMGGHTFGDSGYAFVGKNSYGEHIMSMQAPASLSGEHFLTRMGEVPYNSNYMWYAFDPAKPEYVFAESDSRRITVTVNFTTGNIVYYLDDQVWGTFGNATGSFADLQSFVIGTEPWSAYDMTMEDFRIYSRELSADDIAALIPEPVTVLLLGFGGLFLRKKR